MSRVETGFRFDWRTDELAFVASGYAIAPHAHVNGCLSRSRFDHERREVEPAGIVDDASASRPPDRR
jgi:hypothetical protein